MTECTPQLFEFLPCKSLKVEADFTGGDVTSNGGILLLREAEQELGLSKEISKFLVDTRQPGKVIHKAKDNVLQRIFAIALGYEDLNDHQTLRDDTAFQTGVGQTRRLASSSTLCRFENQMGPEMFWSFHDLMASRFISSFEKAPKKLVLDFDATDDPVHGNQEGRFFHGYYDHYCFTPLYIFCGDQILGCYLRPANIDGAKHAAGMLKWLVSRLRAAWPDVEIIFRADSGFCRQVLLNWCDRNAVYYITGMAQNERLKAASKLTLDEASRLYKEQGEPQRLFGDFEYGAKSWRRERRIILREEYTHWGSNPRFVVTNLEGDAQYLYEEVYCARGDMENRIKEFQYDLFPDRTSAHHWWPNQFRVFLSAMAYMLIEHIRRVGLKDTRMERARCDTIRLNLLKIGAVIIRNTRRVRFKLSSRCPHQDLFAILAHRLRAG